MGSCQPHMGMMNGDVSVLIGIGIGIAIGIEKGLGSGEVFSHR
jgi:hypothetical protein